jgi:hypothetical protein
MSEENQLVPGRELDEAVAVKRGWHKQFNPAGNIWYWADSNDEPANGVFEFNRTEPYSTDIAAAWKIFQFVMANAYYSRRQKFYRLLQEQNKTSDGSLIAWPDLLGRLSDNFPLAICRAFLALEGVIYERSTGRGGTTNTQGV